MGSKSLLVALAAAAGLVVFPGSAAAPAGALSGLLAELNAIRAQLGLAALRPNPLGGRLVKEIAAHDTADVPPEVLDSQPDCAVCQVFFDASGRSSDPRRLYAQQGGTGRIGFALWRAGWSARRNLSVFFPAAALVLDPRARTFSAARTPKGLLLIAVTVDPAAPFHTPIRWPAGAVDPERQLWLEVVTPLRAHGQPRLTDRRGRKEIVTAYPLADVIGVAGARLAAYGLNAALTYSHRYTARLGSASVRVATRSIPGAFLHRSWTFASMSPRARRTYLGIVARTPPLMRKIAHQIDGAVRVVGHGRGCSIADACEYHEGDALTSVTRVQRVGVTISFRRLDPFVILHELGHAVFDLALDEPGRRLFLKAFVRAGWGEAGATPLTEIFADQLAFWALGFVPPGIDSYSDRMYLSRSRFARLLGENAGYRPLSTIGPLHR